VKDAQSRNVLVSHVEMKLVHTGKKSTVMMII